MCRIIHKENNLFLHYLLSVKTIFNFVQFVYRMSGLSLEEYDLLGDAKYRAYVAAVDKTLRNFENTSEWADLISTLGKLNKVL